MRHQGGYRRAFCVSRATILRIDKEAARMAQSPGFDFRQIDPKSLGMNHKIAEIWTQPARFIQRFADFGFCALQNQRERPALIYEKANAK
jgi:hypothetical protein